MLFLKIAYICVKYFIANICTIYAYYLSIETIGSKWNHNIKISIRYYVIQQTIQVSPQRLCLN